jgi:hypothetical protein
LLETQDTDIKMILWRELFSKAATGTLLLITLLYTKNGRKTMH